MSSTKAVLRSAPAQPQKMGNRVRTQVAALCYRRTDKGKEVLLVTTRGTGRWMLPKGWPMKGKSKAEAAAIEAWEEAGVKPAKVGKKRVGVFDYLKIHDNGRVDRCIAKVYPIKVDKVKDKFPEAGQRKRTWVPLKKAARMVEEKSLRDLLLKA